MELRGLEPRSCRNFPRDSVHSDKNTSTLAAPSLQSSMTLLAQTTTPIADGWLRDLYGISIVCSLPKRTPPDSDRHGMKNCYNFLIKEGYVFPFNGTSINAIYSIAPTRQARSMQNEQSLCTRSMIKTTLLVCIAFAFQVVEIPQTYRCLHTSSHYQHLAYRFVS